MLEILAQDLDALDHRIKGGQPLLAVNNHQAGWFLFGLNTNGSRIGGQGILPEKQVADRIATVHRVEQIPDLGILPDERPLDVRKTDLA